MSDSKPIIRLPLKSLVTDHGEARFVSDLDFEKIRQLLRAGPIRFVVANVGHPLHWIDPSKCFDFWKNEVQAHLAQSEKIRLDDYPGGYLYSASEWSDSGLAIVVLEMWH